MNLKIAIAPQMRAPANGVSISYAKEEVQRFSLRSLSDLGVSVVIDAADCSTTETQRTQRLPNETFHQDEGA